LSWMAPRGGSRGANRSTAHPVSVPASSEARCR
jgi:hypothetical protein